MAGVFDYVKSITQTKQDLSSEPKFESEYIPFIVNKTFSFHLDTIFYANQMNLYNHLPKQLQYAYYINIVRAKPRFSKWHKKDKEQEELVDLISNYFQINRNKARSLIPLLNVEDINEIKIKTNKGGMNE